MGTIVAHDHAGLVSRTFVFPLPHQVGSTRICAGETPYVAW